MKWICFESITISESVVKKMKEIKQKIQTVKSEDNENSTVRCIYNNYTLRRSVTKFYNIHIHIQIE